jgi:hypothetical protein
LQKVGFLLHVGHVTVGATLEGVVSTLGCKNHEDVLDLLISCSGLMSQRVEQLLLCG